MFYRQVIECDNILEEKNVTFLLLMKLYFELSQEFRDPKLGLTFSVR